MSERAERAEKKTVVQLVEELEATLHEELPEAVRAHLRDFQAIEEPVALTQMMRRLESLQMQIGMATFEAVRRGDNPTHSRREEESFQPQPPAAPFDPTRLAPPVTAPAPRCGGCATFSIAACPSCNVWFCSKHLPQAEHPCGDLV